MTVTGNYFHFETTDREVYAHKGIIGLKEDMEDVYYGYDGILGEEFWEDEESQKLSQQEKTELSDYMISLWTKFKNQAI